MKLLHVLWLHTVQVLLHFMVPPGSSDRNLNFAALISYFNVWKEIAIIWFPLPEYSVPFGYLRLALT